MTVKIEGAGSHLKSWIPTRGTYYILTTTVSRRRNDVRGVARKVVSGEWTRITRALAGKIRQQESKLIQGLASRQEENILCTLAMYFEVKERLPLNIWPKYQT